MHSIIYLGTDHGGFSQKEALKGVLQQAGFTLQDCGAFMLDPDDDYPPVAFTVAQQVAGQHIIGNTAFGVLLCRSGIGMAIAANKVAGIRAATIRSVAEAQHARIHDDVNVISLPADEISIDEMEHILKVFLNTQFSNEERHKRRIKQITQYEQKD